MVLCPCTFHMCFFLHYDMVYTAAVEIVIEDDLALHCVVGICLGCPW